MNNLTALAIRMAEQLQRNEPPSTQQLEAALAAVTKAAAERGAR